MKPRFLIFAVWAICAVCIQTASSQTKERMENDVFVGAVINGDLAKVTALLGSNPKLASSKDNKGRSAILLAVYHGRKEVAGALLKTGISLDIFEAAATGETGILRSLIAKDKPQIDAYASDGFFPLGLAIFFGHPESALALLEAGANINMASRESMKVTPLHAAVASGQISIARELLKRGAKVNARSENDFVALHEASARGNIEFAKLLLENGADINAKTTDGKTPLDFAVSADKTEMVKFLRERGAVR